MLSDEDEKSVCCVSQQRTDFKRARSQRGIAPLGSILVVGKAGRGVLLFNPSKLLHVRRSHTAHATHFKDPRILVVSYPMHSSRELFRAWCHYFNADTFIASPSPQENNI